MTSNNSKYNPNEIDTENVNAIAKQIASIDLTKFKRASNGIDLYSGKTNINLQRHIALTQAGLYVSGVDVKKLNSGALNNLYSNNNVKLAHTDANIYSSKEILDDIKEEENFFKTNNDIEEENFFTSKSSNPFS